MRTLREKDFDVHSKKGELVMCLKTYLGKSVCIKDRRGKVFSGVVDDYFFPEDNEDGKESIVLITSSEELYEFTMETIERIYVIKCMKEATEPPNFPERRCGLSF